MGETPTVSFPVAVGRQSDPRDLGVEDSRAGGHHRQEGAHHEVPKEAKVTIDEKDAKLVDLKPHTPVKVTMKEEGGKHVITKVEATTTKDK